METIRAILKERKEIAEQTFELVLEAEHHILCLPGQYITLTLPEPLYPDKRGNGRNLSLVSVPDSEGHFTVAFRMSESGFKRTLAELPLSSEISVTGPKGVFGLPNTNAHPIIMVAGGIGITPFMSMIDYHTSAKLPFQLTLLYANSSPARAVYRDKLARYEETNPNFTVRNIYGDIDAEFLKSGMSDKDKLLWYVAGPPGMVYAVQAQLHWLGVAEGDILTEMMTGYETGVHLASEVHHIVNNETAEGDQSFAPAKRISKSLLDVLDKIALVVMTDAEGNITYANKEFCVIAKYSLDELMGQNHRILKSGHHPQSFYEELWKTISGGKVWRGEIKNRAKDGSFYWLDTAIAPVFGNTGAITSYIAVRFPITDRKRVEEALERAANVAYRAAKESAEKNVELKKVKDNLEKNVSELRKFQKLIIGRELKMVELKKKISLLENNKQNI